MNSKKKDRFFLPFDLKTSCVVNGYHFILKGAIPKRDPMGRCGYNSDPRVSILLNGKTIIYWVAFDETCMGDTSLVKLVLTLKNNPKMLFCLTEDIRPRDVISTNNSCKTVKLNNLDLIPLTQDKLEILQAEIHSKIDSK